MSSVTELEGLLWKFPVNRPLTEQETADRLSPKEAYAGVKPQTLGGLIRMNSTFLEIRDKFFLEKGGWTLRSLFVFVLFGYVLMAMTWEFVVNKWPTLPPEKLKEAALVLAAFYVMFIPLIFVFWRFRFRKECFCYTHYPIRFDRRTRKVHVFRLDGTVMTAAWDELFFTQCRHRRGHGGEWEVRAHRLAPDGQTVLETFALYRYGERGSQMVLGLWEFIRRYMEEGPEAVIPHIDQILDIDVRRETWWEGVQVLQVCAPFLFVNMIIGIARQISMATCKFPKFPEEIDAECAYDEDDPYLVDAEHLTEKLKELGNR
jgi:hypothetical protein